MAKGRKETKWSTWSLVWTAQFSNDGALICSCSVCTPATCSHHFGRLLKYKAFQMTWFQRHERQFRFSSTSILTIFKTSSESSFMTIIHKIDPHADIVSPSTLYSNFGLLFLVRMLHVIALPLYSPFFSYIGLNLAFHEIEEDISISPMIVQIISL